MSCYARQRYSGWDGLPLCILVYWYLGGGSIGKTLEEVDPQSYDIRLKMEILIFAIYGCYCCTSVVQVIDVSLTCVT